MALKEEPSMPAQAPKMKYKVPISLWLVEYSHRVLLIPHTLSPPGLDCRVCGINIYILHMPLIRSLPYGRFQDNY